MKAVVLCAGEGTRLRPLTHTSAKHLIPVANRPVIAYTIEAIRESGINEIGVVVSPNVEEEFKLALGDGSKWDVQISYILQESPKGLAHAVSCAKEFVKNEPFLVYLGDNLLENGVTEIVKEFQRSKTGASLLLTEVKDPSSFGVASLAKDRIVKLVEKPKHPPSNLAVVGVYLFSPTIFEAIAQIKPSWRGELEITDAIQWLIDQGIEVRPHLVKGWWKDVGRPEDMIDANRLILEKLELQIFSEIGQDSKIVGRVSIAEGVQIRASELRGPLLIGPGAVIENSFIGPFTSIGQGVRIVSSEIEYSIVMSGASIEGAGRVDHSLIGRNVRIFRGKRPPETYHFVIGDNSEVRLV
ncbi:glucose-1-phosphate thymidylyltransferase [Candidatus Acetothermia bacterium]|nr:glucose-1-phosphate thymidylyltransferase [Candidatus Acetothermia bacterium]MBI3644039.1 glucose-1-phosphate thymidylyltransferase [Candidatus Acetothermia bacterium]